MKEYDILVGTSYKEAFEYAKKNKLDIQRVVVVSSRPAMIGLPAEEDRVHLLDSVTRELYDYVNSSMVSRGMDYVRVPSVIDHWKRTVV